MAGEDLRDLVDRLRQALGPPPGREVPDGELLRRWLDHKDQAAFELLVWRHAPMLLGVCRRLLGDEHEAEDAVQAAFLVLARKGRSIRRREALAAWLYRVAYRVALESRARRQRWPAANERALLNAASPPHAERMSDELRPLLDQEIERLPEKYRVPFVLCHLQGRSNEEAARSLGCPLGTIVSRLSRARARLRGRLSRRGVSVSTVALATVFSSAGEAAISPVLVHAIVQTAGSFLAGGSAAAAISPQVAGLAKGVIYTMFMTKVRTAALTLMVLVAGAGAGTGLAFQLGGTTDEPGGAFQHPPGRARADVGDKKPGAAETPLAAFDRLSPAARWQALGKLADAGREFQPVARGDIAGTVIERGALQAARSSAVASPLDGRIKSIIDNGSSVKKGDRLLVLDYPELAEQAKKQMRLVQKARDERTKAAAEFELVRKEGRLDLRFADIDARLAELEVRRRARDAKDPKDPLEKQALELKLERVRLQLERVKLSVEAREHKAMAELRAKEAAVEQAHADLDAIEQQARRCEVKAPQDGLVVYSPRLSPYAAGTVIEEGQTVLHIADPTHLNVHTRVHESVIFQVRAGQEATVRVDALPNRLLAARVQKVATTASRLDWKRTGVKVYDVHLELLGETPRLLPGMSAEVRIAVGQKKGVLQLPARAVLRNGVESYCYVKAGKEIERRKVTPGLTSDGTVEIKSGVSEGEEVLRDPRAVLERRRP
jgi:RND family efflux transporter MFP subunit